METSINSENKLTMVTQITNEARFQILEFDELKGISDISKMNEIQMLNKYNVKLRQIRIILENSGVKLSNESLSYMKGDISNKKDNLLSGISKKILGGEIKNSLYGKGEIFLEPSFEYFALIKLDDEEIKIGQSIFCACEDDIELTLSEKDNMDSDYILSGSGIVAIKLPVPENEIFKCKIYNDTVKVNGDIIALTAGKIKKSKEIISFGSGEDTVINVYSGIGEVWIIPTKKIYNR